MVMVFLVIVSGEEGNREGDQPIGGVDQFVYVDAHGLLPRFSEARCSRQVGWHSGLPARDIS